MRILKILMGVFISINVNAEITGSSTKWESEITDAGTGKMKTFAAVRSQDESGYIVIFCYKNGIYGKVNAGKPVTRISTIANVIYAIDDDAKTADMLYMEPFEGDATFDEKNGMKFVNALRGGKKEAIVMLRGANDETSTAKFTLAGSTKAINAVLNSCDY